MAAPPPPSARPPSPTPEGSGGRPSPLDWSATPFRAVQLLGQGGMGAVFRAQDLRTGRAVALKQLSAADPARRERFRREGQLAARLTHPNVVRVHELYELPGGQILLVTELIEGARPLDEAWRGAPLARRVEWLLATARGVAAAHAEGIVHRDLKPDNVLVDARGEARVGDFGVAFARDLERLTRTGALVGTPTCMSPEQFKGERPGPASDVWSLGVLLHLALCDELPFVGQNLAALASAISRGFGREQLRLLRDAPRELTSLVQRCLHPDPAQRPSEGAAFARELEAWLSGAERARRARLPLAGAGLLACLILGLAALAPLAAGERRGALATPSASSPGAAEGPADTPSASQRARAAALRRALSQLEEGAARGAANALRELDPPLRAQELGPLRQRLVADALTADAGSGALLERVARLRLCAELLPRAERGRLEAPLVERVVATLAGSEAELQKPQNLRLLTSLADLGARVEDRELGLRLASRLFDLASLGGLPRAQIGEWFQLLLRLDVPTPFLSTSQFRFSLAGRAPDEGLRRFVELRSTAGDPQAPGRMREFLRSPAGRRLGPRQWADALARAASAQPPERAIPALEEALARDPESVSALTELAISRSLAGQREPTREAARRCVATMERFNYPRYTATRNSYGRRLHQLAGALARVDAWEEAQDLARAGAPYPSSSRERLLQDFPQLAE